MEQLGSKLSALVKDSIVEQEKNKMIKDLEDSHKKQVNVLQGALAACGEDFKKANFEILQLKQQLKKTEMVYQEEKSRTLAHVNYLSLNIQNYEQFL